MTTSFYAYLREFIAPSIHFDRILIYTLHKSLAAFKFTYKVVVFSISHQYNATQNIQKCHEYTWVSFPKHMAWRGIMFWLVLHGCLVFPSTRASLNAYMYNLNLQSNHTEAKILSTRIFGGKSGVEKISTNIFYSGNSGRNNQKVIQVRAGRNLSLKLVNTCEKTSQLSWKSRVIHSIMLCVCLQGHIQEGGRSSLFFAYLCTYFDKKN